MRYPYDPAKAKALLDEAGWKPGPDGVRVKNGQRLAFQMSTQTESIAGKALQEQLQTYWRTVGAAAEVKNYPTPLFFDNTANGVLQGGKYDVATFAWVGAADIDNNALYSAHNFAPHGQNSLFWNNPVATKAMDDANQTVDRDSAASPTTRSRSASSPRTTPRSSSTSARTSKCTTRGCRTSPRPRSSRRRSGASGGTTTDAPAARRRAGAARLRRRRRAAGAQGGRHPWTVPHVLRYATGEDVVGLNPHLDQQLTLSYMSSLTMAWLLQFDHRNRPVPELATAVPSRANGGVSADGKTITYHLRRDAKWSDGVPFTAADVKFSTDVVRNPANNEGTHQGFDQIARVDTPDPYTVVFRLVRPYSGFYVNFFSSGGANPCILPEHLLDKLPNINQAPYNALPVGIGPFKYASWKRGDSIELVPNPLYFGRKPKLERVVFKIIPDRNTTLTQLTTHEIDLWLPVPGAYFDRVRALPGIAITRQAVVRLQPHRLRARARRAARSRGAPRAAAGDRPADDPGQDPARRGHPAGDAVRARPPVPRRPAAGALRHRRGRTAMLDRAGWKRGADGVRAKAGSGWSSPSRWAAAPRTPTRSSS